MSADPVDPAVLEGLARNAPADPAAARSRRPRRDAEVRLRRRPPVLERASARETAARVALGAGGVVLPGAGGGCPAGLAHRRDRRGGRQRHGLLPTPGDTAATSTVTRCAAWDPAASERMVAEIDDCRKAGDTLGGVVEVWPTVCRPAWAATCTGTGGWTRGSPGRSWASRPSRAWRSATASSWPAPRLGGARRDRAGSEPGSGGGRDGPAAPRGHVHRRGAAGPGRHEADQHRPAGPAHRRHDHRRGAPGHHQRSDVCAVPAAGVVAEAMVALVLADAVLEKFGGDSVPRPPATTPPTWTRCWCGGEHAGQPAGPRVVLVGPPGAGKSTVGSLLAEPGTCRSGHRRRRRGGSGQASRDLRRRRRTGVPDAEAAAVRAALDEHRRRRRSRRRGGARPDTRATAAPARGGVPGRRAGRREPGWDSTGTGRCCWATPGLG
jgi:chorismate synthase